MNTQKTEPRYRKVLRDLKSSKASKFWNAYVVNYSKKGWGFTRKIMWGLSVGAIISLLPVAIETVLEGEARVMQLNSQIKGEINPNVELRPY